MQFLINTQNISLSDRKIERETDEVRVNVINSMSHTNRQANSSITTGSPIHPHSHPPTSAHPHIQTNFN